jgi:hypothetical protein
MLDNERVFLRSASRRGRRAFRALRRLPLPLRMIAGTAALVVVWAAVNAVVQVIRKPTEVFAVTGSLAKVPARTWREYGPLFDAHATAIVTPDLLAALAQVESSGDPIARTYWRWRLSWNPFEVYRPASSAVGMFQITDGTFAEARRYCIRDNVVVEDGPWHDLDACWFNALYTRVVPGHAVEMTAALLDRTVARTVGRHPIATASLTSSRARARLARYDGQNGRLAPHAHLHGAAAALLLTRGTDCGPRAALRRVEQAACHNAWPRPGHPGTWGRRRDLCR